ncbi:MAG: hypothetical protein LBH43_07760 [Treponema sp.]|jgi:hypothetical protein|nr:hypothetical protein [Treponema sp.]
MNRISIFMISFIICLFSCVHNPNAYHEIDMSIGTASYIQALHAMEKNDDRRAYTTRNDILFYLDRGMLRHYAGLWNESSRDLEEGERLIEEAFTKSISQEIGSYIANDNVKDYAGEDYENIYINVFNALNYYHRNDMQNAHVEIRRVNEKLTVLADKYEKAIKKVIDSNPDLSNPDLGVQATKFSNSALARYISFLFSQAEGNTDNVRIDMEELQRAYTLAPDVYDHPKPSSLENELSVPQGKARLNFIGFTGLSPIKEEVKQNIPLSLMGGNDWFSMSLPRMVDRPSDIDSVEVVLNSGQRFRLELLENMSKIAHETFKTKYSLTVAKTAARTITKATAATKTADLVERKFGVLGSLVSGAVGAVAVNASEQADLRVSRYFPARANIGGINLEPGIYSITVNYYGHGRLVDSEQINNVHVEAGKLNLIESVCLK